MLEIQTLRKMSDGIDQAALILPSIVDFANVRRERIEGGSSRACGRSSATSRSDRNARPRRHPPDCCRGGDGRQPRRVAALRHLLPCRMHQRVQLVRRAERHADEDPAAAAAAIRRRPPADAVMVRRSWPGKLMTRAGRPTCSTRRTMAAAGRAAVRV
jgi:hypothetical protein